MAIRKTRARNRSAPSSIRMARAASAPDVPAATHRAAPAVTAPAAHAPPPATALTPIGAGRAPILGRLDGRAVGGRTGRLDGGVAEPIFRRQVLELAKDGGLGRRKHSPGGNAGTESAGKTEQKATSVHFNLHYRPAPERSRARHDNASRAVWFADHLPRWRAIAAMMGHHRAGIGHRRRSPAGRSRENGGYHYRTLLFRRSVSRHHAAAVKGQGAACPRQVDGQ